MTDMANASLKENESSRMETSLRSRPSKPLPVFSFTSSQNESSSTNFHKNKF